jgi:virulence-associated protein VagC
MDILFESEGDWEMESVVFKNGNSLAIRLLGECRLPKGTRVKEYKEGNRIIIEPISNGWSDQFINCLGAWDEEIERPVSKIRDPFQ